MAITFDGNKLSVQTRQVPAGTYGAKVTLSSPSDARYTRTVDIQYNVVPPTGGEHALSVANPVRTISVQQGQGSVQRLIVTRPTWTDAFDSPQVDDPSHILTLVNLGNDQYEASLASAGLAVGQSATATITFSAGPTGGTTATRLTLSVTGAFYVEATQTRALTVTSTAADLDWTGRVLTFDGVPANWTALSLSPWVQLTQASGKTGIDSLRFRINPAVLSSSDPLIFPIQLSIDRPGASPVTVPFSVTDEIPRLQQSSPLALVNTRGRIYVNGRFNADAGGLLSANRLHVTGATLVGAHLVADSRFAGDVVVLAVDVTDLIPDNSMTISVDSALVPSQVQLRVQAPLRAAAAYQALPYGAYRPAQFAVGSKALYFSGPGTAFRWAFDGSAWSLAMSAVSGLIDVAMSPDESTLYASDPTHVISQDPNTFALRSTGTLQGPPQSTTVFDKNSPTGGRAIVFSADGRAIGSISDVNFTDSHGVGWICDKLDYSNRIESAPGPCDPGVQQTPTLNTPVGLGLLRSANGDFIVGFGSHGERTVYQPETRAWVRGPALPPGLLLVAANDTGTRLVRSDGMLLGPNDTQFGSLASAVPFTHVAGGYGISSGGRFGFVYGYRLEGSGSTQTASEATLWVLDLSLASSVGVGSAPVIAAIPLPQAVGCTSPFANGETCQHSASISIAPGDGTAFIVGSRGIVAVPLPAAVTPAAVTVTTPVVRAASRPTLWTPAAASQPQR